MVGGTYKFEKTRTSRAYTPIKGTGPLVHSEGGERCPGGECETEENGQDQADFPERRADGMSGINGADFDMSATVAPGRLQMYVAVHAFIHLGAHLDEPAAI